jgi:hypothetical protein
MTKNMRSGRGLAAFLALATLVVAGCEGAEVVGEYPNRRRGDSTPYDFQRRQNDSLFGPGGLSFGVGGERQNQDDQSGGGIGVNGFLWRASLDTLSFLPVNSADPFGGVIITDWHAMPEAPDERFKMNVFILGRSLRADGVRVAVFRQVRDPSGWADAPVAIETAGRIEDAILVRARQLRFAALQQ